MTNLSAYKSDQPLKILLIGDSGNGKTGALASLALAGHNLRIQDYDNGLESLFQQLKSSPEALSRVKYESLQDPLKSIGGKIFPIGQPTAFSRGLALLDTWKTADEDLGPPAKWDRNTILVLDSLTMMSNAAMRRALSLVGRSGDQPQIQDWGLAMSNIEDTLGLLYSDAFQCHVIVISHITYIGNEEGGQAPVGYPNTLGNKLPPKVGRYFNTVLGMEKTIAGGLAKRTIRTQSLRNVSIKCPIPGIAAELPIESGLATLFKMAAS